MTTPIASSLNGGILYSEQNRVSTFWPVNRLIRASSFSRRAPYNNAPLGPISERIWSTTLSTRIPHTVSSVTPTTTIAAAVTIIRCLHRMWLSNQNKYFAGGLHGDQSCGNSDHIAKKNSATKNIISMKLPKSRQNRAALSVSSRDNGFTECVWTADDYKTACLVADCIGIAILFLLVIAMAIFVYFTGCPALWLPQRSTRLPRAAKIQQVNRLLPISK